MQERGEFNHVANKLADLSEEDAGANWLSTKIEKPVNKRAATVVMTGIRASGKAQRSAAKSDGPPAKAPPAGMEQYVPFGDRARGSNEPMQQAPMQQAPMQQAPVQQAQNFADGRNIGGKGGPAELVRGRPDDGKGPGGDFGIDRRTAA